MTVNHHQTATSLEMIAVNKAMLFPDMTVSPSRQVYLRRDQSACQASNASARLSASNAFSAHEPRNRQTDNKFNVYGFVIYEEK